jgi:alcohol dehydrogenase class IV
MVRPFTFQAHIPRTIFGNGTLSQIPDEVKRLNVRRVLLVTENTDRQIALADQISKSLGGLVAGV